MGVREPAAGLARQLDGLVRGHAAQLAECPAGHVLHHDVRPPVLRFTGVVDADHVRVREPRRQPRLAQEPLAEGGVAGQVFGEQLERYRPMQLLVLREVDGRHAAVAERALEPVAAALHSGLAQPSPCFPWCPWCGLCFLGPGAGFGSTQVAVRAASEFAAEVSGSW